MERCIVLGAVTDAIAKCGPTIIDSRGHVAAGATEDRPWARAAFEPILSAVAPPRGAKRSQIWMREAH